MSVLSKVRSRLKRQILEALISQQARDIRHKRLTYLSPQKLRRLERTAAQLIRDGVPGDLMEFGVALGGSSILLASMARKNNRPFHGFDVFGMIPPPTDNDSSDVKQRYETIVSGKSKGIGSDDYYGYRTDLIGDVTRSFSEFGLQVDGAQIALHKGLFQDTWPIVADRTIAFAHIDCDWYDPVKFCLDRISGALSPGGVMLLDDYHDYASCRRATDEFLNANRGFRKEDGDKVILRKV